jgi:protein-S-isoprenylcysteine O-methyltransferase Ste14
LAGYLGLAGFLAIEGLARERGSASSLKSSSDDQGTTYLLGVTYAFLAFAPAYLRRIPMRQLPRFAAALGLMMQLGGLGLRYWSMRTLRASYSRTLRSEVDQQVIDAGPYRLIRHPGYLGSLMTWTGFALTSRRSPVVATVVALSGVYRYRITAEEQMLTRDLAGYADYTDRTKRLIPLVW